MAFQTHSEPCGFNPEFRPGFGDEVSRMYSSFCENNPGLTRLLRKRVHRVIEDSVIHKFPTTVELGTYHPGCWRKVK
jgi:hypothetical protein